MPGPGPGGRGGRGEHGQQSTRHMPAGRHPLPRIPARSATEVCLGKAGVDRVTRSSVRAVVTISAVGTGAAARGCASLQAVLSPSKEHTTQNRTRNETPPKTGRQSPERAKPTRKRENRQSRKGKTDHPKRGLEVHSRVKQHKSGKRRGLSRAFQERQSAAAGNGFPFFIMVRNRRSAARHAPTGWSIAEGDE